MKSHQIQSPVVVILGNADNIGCQVAKIFAAQGAVIAMLTHDNGGGDRGMGNWTGGNHLHVAGRLDESSELTSFAGLVHSLYGRVDKLICCEDASVALPNLPHSAQTYMTILLEHIFTPGASVVNMASRCRKFTAWKNPHEKEPSGLSNLLSRQDVRINHLVLHRPLTKWNFGVEDIASATCAATLFLCSEEASHINREYIVVNRKKAALRFQAGARLSAAFLKPYLDFCMSCTPAYHA